MSESMTVSTPNEAIVGTGTVSGAAPVVIGGWGDMAKDMAALEKETGIPVMTPAQPESTTSQAVVTLPAPVATPVAQTAPQTPVVPAVAIVAPVVPAVEVPEKFRGADGKVDQEKLLKSYTAIEKEFGRKANELNALKANPTAAVPQTPAPATAAQVGNLTPLELQVARDIFNGGGFTEAQAISVARTQVRLADAAGGLAAERALGPVSQLMESQNEQRRVNELQSLAKNYPDVLTPKGFEELVKVREENPWINQSPEPWRAAAQILVGQKGLQGQAGTVVIPTPTGAQNQPIPVTPSSPAAGNPIELNTPRQIEAYVKTLTPAQEAEFWTKAGMKWDVPRAAFKGI